MGEKYPRNRGRSGVSKMVGLVTDVDNLSPKKNQLGFLEIYQGVSPLVSVGVQDITILTLSRRRCVSGEV